jgi:hypothetical protein
MPFLFGGNKAFCAQVNIQILEIPFEYQRIVGDCPAVLDERSPDRVVIDVFSGR